MPRPVLVLQHAPWETPGLIDVALRDLLVERRTIVDIADPDLPRVRDLAGLVVLGGHQDADDGAGHPGLVAERQLLAEAVDADVPVLGVCLGMQLLGLALGAELHRRASREIGFAPVDLSLAAVSDPVLGPLAGAGRRPDVLHWHSDTVDLPAGATLLAHTEATGVQAFRAGSALGLQFHAEMDADLLARWLAVESMREDLLPGEAERMTADGATHLPRLREPVLTGLATLADAMAARG